jgi:hypothetical protein
VRSSRRARRGLEGDIADENEVAIYCPECVEREQFDWIPDGVGGLL